MIVVVPCATPVTTPEETPIVATPVLLLDHVPPGTASVRVVVPPIHKGAIPIIGGAVFTVTINVDVQPAAVYDIIVVPPLTLVTSPVTSTEATVGVLLLQVPPAVVLLNAVVKPRHIEGTPSIGVALLVLVIVPDPWKVTAPTQAAVVAVQV